MPRLLPQLPPSVLSASYPPLTWHSTWIHMSTRYSEALAATMCKTLHQIVATSNSGCFVTFIGLVTEASSLLCKTCAQMVCSPSFTTFWTICGEKVLSLFCHLPRAWRYCLQRQDEDPCFCSLRSALVLFPFSHIQHTLHSIVLPHIYDMLPTFNLGLLSHVAMSCLSLGCI